MDAVIKEILDEFGPELIGEIHSAMEVGKINATKQSAESLRYETPDSGFILYGAESFSFIEQGRGPGGKPPFSHIEEWVVARGIEKEDEKATRSFVFAIMNKIAQEGTALHVSGERRDVYTSVITSERIESLFSLIASTMTRKVSSDIVNAFR